MQPKFSRPKEVELTKQKIRSRLLASLKIQKEEERDNKSRLIAGKLFRSRMFRKAKTVMFYIAFDGEVDTQEMIRKAQKLGKRVAVPVCRKDRTMRPCILHEGAKLKKGLYGIGEPIDREYVTLDAIDLVVVPAVALDKNGNRLGRGKGYYDRFLKELPQGKPYIGLAFDFQILPRIPITELDMPVQRTIFA
jgi:5-formyltetrahydrofolate cyclo-ligase